MNLICSANNLKPFVDGVDTRAVEKSSPKNDCFYRVPVIASVYNKSLQETQALTPQFTRPLVLRASPKLASNLEAAAKTITHVGDTILFSTNRSKNPSGLSERTEFTSPEFQYFETLRMLTIFSKSGTIMSEYAEQLQVGNCMEMSYIGEKFLHKSLNNPNVEPCFIKGGDHGFLIIGRNQTIPIEEFVRNPALDPDAVVCDPWSGAYYPASELHRYLKDFVGWAEDSEGRFYVQVEDFDSAFQSLGVLPFVKLTSQKELQLKYDVDFFSACGKGDKNAVLKLLTTQEKDASISSYGCCIGLTIAMKNGYSKIVQTILKNKKDIPIMQLKVVRDFSIALNNKELTQLLDNALNPETSSAISFCLIS